MKLLAVNISIIVSLITYLNLSNDSQSSYDMIVLFMLMTLAPHIAHNTPLTL